MMLIRLPDNLVHVIAGNRTRCGKPLDGASRKVQGGTMCQVCNEAKK